MVHQALLKTADLSALIESWLIQNYSFYPVTLSIFAKHVKRIFCEQFHSSLDEQNLSMKSLRYTHVHVMVF